MTITALSFAVLHYPDGTKETVWLPDGNVKYFQGKHIPLALVAILIIIVGLPYTILLLWQWLVCASKWKVCKWTQSAKLSTFIATYYAPYNSKYRYWTGLLLLARVVLYLSVSVTVSDNPQASLLATIILLGGIFLLKGIITLKLHRNLTVDIVNTVLYFNILALTVFTLYHFKVDTIKQIIVSYTSTIITFLLLVGVIFHHVALPLKRDKPAKGLNDYPRYSSTC